MVLNWGGAYCWAAIAFQARKSIKEGKTPEKAGNHLLRILVARIMFASKK